MLRHDVVRVFVSNCVLVFVRVILSWCPKHLHCLQHSLYEHLFHLSCYSYHVSWVNKVTLTVCVDYLIRNNMDIQEFIVAGSVDGVTTFTTECNCWFAVING